MVGEQESEYYIEDALAIGELDAALEYATNEMAAFAQSPFACINDQAFTNSVKQVADDLAAFIENESQHMTIRAIYTETNGFAWNTDLWFFNWFAYSLPVGHPDHEFGCWQSNDTTMHTLEGMENLQRLYTNRSDESGADYACEQCVILRFFELIIAALETFNDLPFPVVLSSHDCGFEFEVRRKDGKTYLGRLHRNLDAVERSPSQFENLIHQEAPVAFSPASFYEEPKWLHRVSLRYLPDVEFDPPTSCQFSAKEPVDPRCAQSSPLFCKEVKHGEGWPDFVSESAYRLLVSERLLEFLRAQPGAASLYHSFEVVYDANGCIPTTKYHLLQPLDHRDAIDWDRSEFHNDRSGGRGRLKKLVLRSEAVDSCMHLFRLTEDSRIVMSRSLATVLHQEDFTGFYFLPIETSANES